MDFFEVQFPFAASIHYGANLEVVFRRDFWCAPLAFLLLSSAAPGALRAEPRQGRCRCVLQGGFCCCISNKSAGVLSSLVDAVVSRDICRRSSCGGRIIVFDVVGGELVVYDVAYFPLSSLSATMLEFQEAKVLNALKIRAGVFGSMCGDKFKTESDMLLDLAPPSALDGDYFSTNLCRMNSRIDSNGVIESPSVVPKSVLQISPKLTKEERQAAKKMAKEAKQAANQAARKKTQAEKIVLKKRRGRM
eukprot:scaffold3280_cov54-Attheya_sp.AAC.3